MLTEMQTSHVIRYSSSTDMSAIRCESVNLVVTSPPYPMIEMWDDIFSSADPRIRTALDSGYGEQAHELMNFILYDTWTEVNRVLVPGGIACINVGDATRKLGGHFQLYSNHTRVTRKFIDMGFHALPHIIWRKQTNKPNKFMGSGMMPPNAYVTLEHEFILVFRKGGIRKFKDDERKKRRESAYFREERNIWFSDVWSDLKGVPQRMGRTESRGRSGAFPFELPYRLISMYSIQGDKVLDPFLGTGTTSLTAMHTGRNSIGYEQDEGFREMIEERMRGIVRTSGEMVRERMERHREFVRDRESERGRLKYDSVNYCFRVMTAQERDMRIPVVRSVVFDGDAGVYRVEYGEGEDRR